MAEEGGREGGGRERWGREGDGTSDSHALEPPKMAQLKDEHEDEPTEGCAKTRMNMRMSRHKDSNAPSKVLSRPLYRTHDPTFFPPDIIIGRKPSPKK